MSDPVAPAPAGTPSTDAPASDPATTEAPAPAAAVAAPPAPAKRKIKVYGEERELNDDELVAWAQKGAAADKRFEELSAKEKKIQADIQRLKEKPWEAAKDLTGEDLRERLIKELMEEWNAEQLKANDPLRFEAEQAKKEAASERKRREEIETQLKSQEEQKFQQQVAEETFATFDAALGKVGGERTPDLILEMIDLEIHAVKNGHTYTPEQLAAAVKSRHEGVQKTVVSREFERLQSLDGETLLSAVPEGLWKAVQKALLARARSAIQRPVAPRTIEAPAPEPTEKPKYVSDAALLRSIMRD
jgi:hypothetical protein